MSVLVRINVDNFVWYVGRTTALNHIKEQNKKISKANKSW